MASSNFIVARMEWASKLAKAIEITREMGCIYSVVLFSCQIYSIYVICSMLSDGLFDYLNFESYIYSNKN